MKKLFIIKAGSTFPETAKNYGDFEEMARRVSGLERKLVEVVDAV